jgi:cobalamin biosynthesis Mg chelatase CobN
MTHTTSRWSIGLATGVLLLAYAVVFTGTSADAGETTLNQVSDWCNGEDGTKYEEPVDTPFIVPAPPDGTVWTLIVLKAGTTNETVPYPVVGDSYSHSEHDNSHIILCWEALSTSTIVVNTTVPDDTTTTTTISPTTTLPTSTTTSEAVTTTTEQSTTTTDPTTTSSSTTTTSVDPTTTSTSVDPSTTTEPSTVPQTTSTVTTSTLPVTGFNADDVVPFGVALLVVGVVLLSSSWLVGRLRSGS